jgi:hypothetical protein
MLAYSIQGQNILVLSKNRMVLRYFSLTGGILNWEYKSFPYIKLTYINKEENSQKTISVLKILIAGFAI